MPTARGWAAIGTAAALFALWAAFGDAELMTTAAFLLAAVAIGMIIVRIASPSVTIDRNLHPPNAHEGDLVVVEVKLSTSRRLRNIQLEDTVHGLGVARFAAAKTSPGQPLVARYEVLCRERGAYAVGPAQCAVTDPFGLIEGTRTAGGEDRLIVFPRPERLQGFPAIKGLDPTDRSSRPAYSPHGGDDFFTLREYQIGDDLRKVHWPSTAKRDALMIKQLEIPWQARALVFLDTRADRYPDRDAFEHAVRGAASAVDHLHRGGFTPDLWTSQSPERGPGSSYMQAMDALATVQPVHRFELQRSVSSVRRRGAGGGALIMVTGEPDDDLLGAYRILGSGFSKTIVMIVADDGNRLVAALERSGALTVLIDPAGRWAPSWRNAMEGSWATASAG